MNQDAIWYGGSLGRGHIVLDGDTAPPKTGQSSPIFVPMSIVWPNGWVDQDATWYEGRPRPRRHCVMGNQLPTERGTAALHFRPMSIAAKRSSISANAELLSCMPIDVSHHEE